MNKMYDVVKNVISSRNYDLKDILGKIETVWVQSRITDEQKMELILLAQENAKVENSIDVLTSLYDLNKRVGELENQLAQLKNETNNDIPADDEPEPITYPPYVVGKLYENGDIVSFDGKNYKCIAPIETVCVWSPTEYPAYWAEYVEDKPLTEDNEEDAPLTE